ncbi:uncharacterized protein K441DRAFT_682675 [Cenococcum geophilum 1.58]|uniref:Uncharacterized protein n=1 Tax=Cenococcum geophilum 1.58 TaxID=794803 RepID=A0ACC8EMC1_9PEZI|nr:hypothetical protein K441DRAFT_682675 [Cenococcum geophilum 1.58]
MALHQQERDGRHGMQENRAIQNLPTTTPSPMASDEEIIADVDEPPDDQCTPRPFTSPYPLLTPATFGKTTPRQPQRKESLLTSALNSSGPGSPVEESNPVSTTLSRGLSFASTWSSNSTASTAELTSDGGFTSPGTRTSTPSPPLPSTTFPSIAPIFSKMLFGQPVSIIRQDDENIGPLQHRPASGLSENAVEASLGRKRCITFACGRKDTPKSPPASSPKSTTEQPTAPPKRACTIKFACPTKISTEGPSNGNKPRIVRPASPAPAALKLRGSPKPSQKLHRGSDSTVCNESPQSVRKPFAMRQRKLSGNSDLARSEAFRFHEFASSEEEVDEWLQESTCHRSRLTITDTLKVENTLRQLGEEVEEEVLEDEHEVDLDDEDMDDEDDDMDDEDAEDHEDAEEADGNVSDVSGEGFQTDDEEGFAGSDDDSDTGSDYRWWAPGRSTAAASIDYLDRIRPMGNRSVSESSIGSVDSVSGSIKIAAAPSVPKRRRSRPVVFKAASPELPDSTDFVCGTLDEDRPLEDAYMSCLERRRAAKRRVTPQDIDPTFPTSDPEMDEEEDEEVEHATEESDQHLMMHGQMEPHEDTELRGRRKDGLKKRTPVQSPKRLRSPPPLVKRGRSPPPRRLFGQSPKCLRSPLPTRLRSPPPTRRGSVIISPKPTGLGVRFAALAERPPITEASSLPRAPITTTVGEDSDNGEDTCCELPTRGAIDIKIGLERKRLRRKEKLYQKMHRKACKEKEKRPQPGKGAERMREMGMELAAHKGRRSGLAGSASHSKVDEDMHMLSV